MRGRWWGMGREGEGSRREMLEWLGGLWEKVLKVEKNFWLSVGDDWDEAKKWEEVWMILVWVVLFCNFLKETFGVKGHCCIGVRPVIRCPILRSISLTAVRIRATDCSYWCGVIADVPNVDGLAENGWGQRNFCIIWRRLLHISICCNLLVNPN